jgi:Rad3-related DNA helicase/DNA polymerase III epsilon subunit-like protein
LERPSAAHAAASLEGERLGLLGPLLDATGPLAVVELLTTGPPDRRSSEIVEVGVVTIDAGTPGVRVLHTLVRPRRPLPGWLSRLSGLCDADLAEAPRVQEIAPPLEEALAGRTVIAHDVARVRHFLSRDVSAAGMRAEGLDTRDLLVLTHPDAPDLSLEAYVEQIFERPSRHRALEDAVDLAGILLAVAEGAEGDALRYRNARSALDRHRPDSLWLPLLGKGLPVPEGEEPPHFIRIGPSIEEPVPFDEGEMVEALADEARGRRYFPHYRVRAEQIELARAFHRNLRNGGTLLLEGGTGVGKSLAYLAAAIPFAIERAEQGERKPILISTRTKLLQDQLLHHDIAAAARFLGYPDLRSLSIKGRANYVCEKRLADVLAEGRDTGLLREDRDAWAVLMACARTRPGGEVGALPAALLRRYPHLRELVRQSVARRAEQCSREECGKRRRCPFGARRRELSRAHLVVANHDLLLRWPPDYPSFTHVIVDEGHELAGVADDVYAVVVRPEDLLERIDETFGAPPKLASAGEPGRGMLPRKQRLEAAKQVQEARRALHLDLSAMGRILADRASDYGELQLPPQADRLFPEVARTADAAAARLAGLARLAEELDARAEWTFGEAPEPGSGEGPSPVVRNAEVLRDAGHALQSAFSEDSGDVVAGFERLVMPYDQWTLAIRSVSPASDFHQRFMEGLDSFAAVSASLFVGGDAFASMGELEVEERATFGVDRVSLASPFDYERHMRVVAIQPADDLVPETAAVLALLARELGGRTLGLFTSLRRMHDVADLLSSELAGEEIEVLAPKRAADDPASLVRRFRSAPGGAVLLGARTFWQGLDLPGEDLQAVVIEKLPFEVPTELRKRREGRLREAGINAFQRFTLGKMLLHLKQMTGRLIRSETDRGIVVIVEARPDRRYFSELDQAFPDGTRIQLMDRWLLPGVLAELGLGRSLTDGDPGS